MKIKITTILFLASLLLSISKNSFSQYSSFQKLYVSDLSTFYGTAPFHKPGSTAPSPEQVVCFSTQMATPGKFDIAILKIDSSGFVTANKILTKNPNFHDWARGLMKLGDHYYLTGSSRAFDTSSSSYESTYLVKFDAGLNILSHTNYFLPDREIFASAVTATADSNILITGTTIYNSNRAAFVLKTDTTGNIIWFRQYPAPVDVTYIRELSGGDIMVCGNLSYSFQNIHPIAMRFNSNGNLLWAMNFVFATGPFDYQNSALEFIHDFGNGNILLAGRTDYTFALGAMDSYVIMMNGLGNIVWAKVFGASQNDWPYGYSVTSDNNLVISGSTGSFSLSAPNLGFIQMIDTSGALVSSYAFGDTTSQEQLTLTGFRQVTSAKNLLLGFKMNQGTFSFYTTDFSSEPVGLCPVYPVSFSTANVSYPANTFGVTTDSTIMPYTNNDPFNTYNGINEVWLCNLVTSVDEAGNGKNDFNIFPNPATSEIRIENVELKIERAEIYNTIGEKILSRQLKTNSSQQITIDVSGVGPGVYFLRLQNVEGTHAIKKVVIAHF